LKTSIIKDKISEHQNKNQKAANDFSDFSLDNFRISKTKPCI